MFTYNLPSLEQGATYDVSRVDRGVNRSKKISRSDIILRSNEGQIRLFFDGRSKFDTVVEKTFGIREHDRVVLADSPNCTGTVKWLGCFHDVDAASEHDLIAGVKVVSPTVD